MKAIRAFKQGDGSRLVYEDVPQPQPAAEEVLVRVYASGVSPAELGWEPTWKNRNGLERPAPIPGHEFSGMIAQVGKNVPDWHVGQEVYGLTAFDRDGSEAEYTIALPGELAPKPRALDHIQAAAVPISALTAWQALFDHAHLAAGQTVLIHGASGGVGPFFVQIARWAKAHIIGVGSPQSQTFLHELGCDQVIDYTTMRFEDSVHDADIVIDLAGQDTVERSWKVMKKDGILVSLVKPPSQEDAARNHVRADFFVVAANQPQFARIAELIETGQLRPVISAVLPLEQAQQAYGRKPAGAKPGKVVLQVIES